MLVRKSFQGFGYLSFCSLMSWEANPAELSCGSDNQTTEATSESQGPQEGGYSSFVQELLKDAPKEHIDLMTPYIKKFDAGVTRRFQDLKNQYKHYETLGWDEETTQQMAEVYRVLNEEPEILYNALKNELGIDDGAQITPSEVGDAAESVQGLPPEVQSQLEQQQQVLQALAQWVIDQDKSRTETIEDQEFDDYLDLLRKEYGEFDEDFVLTRIANGMDGEAAVKQWNEVLNGYLEKAMSSTKDLPNALLSSAGGGAVPQETPQKLGSIPDKDIRKLITNVLMQTNQAAQ